MNNKLTDEQVKHVAKLASLTLSESDVEKYRNQLSEILEFVSKLRDIDTSKTIATNQTTGLINVFREDEIDESRILTQEQALANAPDSYNGFFKIPAVLE